MERYRLTKIFAFILLVILVSVISNCRSFSQNSAGEIVNVNREESGEKSTITATGTVRPKTLALLSFRQNASDIRILVTPGQNVQAGEILVSSDTVSQSRVYEETKAKLARAEADYDNLLREEFREVRQAEKDAAFEDIEAAQAQMDLAESNLAAASITAPFDGAVIEIYPNSFENVFAAEPVILIADLNSLEIQTEDLDEKDAGRLEIGDSAQVFFDAIPEVVVKGVITEISQKVAEGAGKDFNLVISLSDIPEKLRWGMSAYVVIETGSSGEFVDFEVDQPISSEQDADPGKTRICDDAYFVDETIADGTQFSALARFTKTWTFRNTGTCIWRPDYKLAFIGGDQMGGPDMLMLGEYVAPGDLVTIKLPQSAPGDEGSYFGSWQFQNELGQKLYDIWVDISVSP